MDLERVKTNLQKRIDEHEAEADRLRATLTQLEDDATATALSVLLEEVGGSGGSAARTRSSRASEDTVMCPFDAEHGSFKRLGIHVKTEHAGQYNEGWSNEQYVAAAK